MQEDPAAQASHGSAHWTIADVERETGIGKNTLRVWERRYGFPSPARDARGERLYDEHQLAQLRLIRRLLDTGHRPHQVVGLPLAALQARAQQGMNPTPSTARLRRQPSDAPADLTPWLMQLRQNQTPRLRAALRAAVREQGLAAVIETLVAPLCVAVGQAWAQGELSVYQEHSFTEAVQTVLREAIAQVEAAAAGASGSPRVLLTTPPGELHQLGLLMAECFFALEGCDRWSLGVSTPLADIAEAAQRLQVDVVALSCSARLRRREVVEPVTQLRQRLPARVELWVGGAGAARHARALPPPVVMLRQAADVAAEVRRWRQRRHLR
ncbi:HTH-type transcriptional repressor CarH [Tepidimonas alkaliphilus]|uniref:HTH-type transcriptional repressor CarH n=1 Tax=Tepidimonas alkaliphilus TaxID=2588942 RepID=A0A554W459_9BURK|nr:MerR family transcriptional regulator [Tepidimonas alkaliphilus]TSE18364.1 HTH-type transcriptional repressor CarH [Tepidimonas alkaliphilus]